MGVGSVGMSVETVLIVDDDPGVRAYVSEALRTGGFAILEAADGATALAIAETSARPVEILVTDVNMPGIDGLELARRVRALSPATGVLYMSGASAEMAATWSLAAGSVFLRKPFGPDALLERVRDAMRRSQPGAQDNPTIPAATAMGRD
jgi:DNA-binding response OmpR family regulator